MANQEFGITHAVILYAAKLLDEENFHALHEMGFGPEECEALRNLSLPDLAALEQRMSGHILRIQLDKPRFWHAYHQTGRETASRALRTKLIKRNAPFDMMRQLFKLSNHREYTQLRQHYGVAPGVGRPVDLEPDEYYRFSEELKNHDIPLDAAAWLAIIEATDLPLRACWKAYRRWIEPPDEEDEARESLRA